MKFMNVFNIGGTSSPVDDCYAPNPWHICTLIDLRTACPPGVEQLDPGDCILQERMWCDPPVVQVPPHL